MEATPLTFLYLPTAILLGALHALEPGHAKTLTAAYLIGIKGTKRDALLLGLSVAATHSVVVVGLSVAALWLGREAFTDRATYWLQLGSGIIVVILGAWLLHRRWRAMQRQKAREACVGHQHEASHEHHDHDHRHDHVHEHGEDHPHHHDDHEHGHHHHDGQDHDEEHDHVHGHDHAHGHHHHHDEDHGHDHDDHDLLTDDEHAAAHAATLPKYVETGERPTALQIVTFGAAGGMIPCPASITVMLLALSVGQAGVGLLTVFGFSLGLAITLVGVGLAVVAGLSKLQSSGRFAWVTRQAPLLSAGLVMFSGGAAIAVAFFHH